MKTLAYDVETTSLYPYEGGEVFAYSTCDEQGNGEVRRLDGPKLRQIRSRKKLEALWSDTSIAKTMHNAKFDLTYTEKTLGRRLDDHEIHCTHKMSHILQSHHPHHRLKDLAWELGGYPRDDEEDVKKSSRGSEVNYQGVAEYKMDRYQMRDAERGMLLHLLFYPEIQANPEWNECYQMEMKLIRTTMRMEARGVMIHRGRCEGLVTRLQRDVKKLKAQLDDINGTPFNPGSGPQLRRLLFGKLKMPVLERTKKSKEPRTNKDTIRMLHEEHPHPVLDLILKWRSYSKGITTIESYMDLADDDDILHPNINTCKARTSRESITRPPLQTVEKTGVLLNPFPVPARMGFRPRPGYVNFHLDYSGIEMRLLIHYSEDPRMTAILNAPGGDVHAAAAEIFYERQFTSLDPSSKMWKSLRDAAKNANFAKPYGASAIKIAKTLGIQGNLALRRVRNYEQTFPGLSELGKRTSRWVREYGYVLTAFGRRLFVPKNKPYIGLNYRIQGTAAGVLKRAQNRVHDYLERATGGEVGIILPIHDEIVIEFPRNRLQDQFDVLRDIRDLMMDFPMFNVPLEVECEVSTSSWERLHKVEILN